MTDPVENMEGGCLCDAIRYRAVGAPFMAEYCHCRMCQKIAGAAAANWMDFRAAQVIWTQGSPTEYQSSANIQRGFCVTCGSSLSFRDTRHPDYITLTINSLDNPNAVKPRRHIYTESQVEWFDVEDECTRFEKGADSSSNSP